MEEMMKNYTITVNGNMYDVTVEEKGAGAAPAAAAPAPAPAAAPAPAPAAAPAASGSAGAVKVKAPMPGKILSIISEMYDSHHQESISFIAVIRLAWYDKHKLKHAAQPHRSHWHPAAAVDC